MLVANVAVNVFEYKTSNVVADVAIVLVLLFAFVFIVEPLLDLCTKKDADDEINVTSRSNCIGTFIRQIGGRFLCDVYAATSIIHVKNNQNIKFRVRTKSHMQIFLKASTFVSYDKYDCTSNVINYQYHN